MRPPRWPTDSRTSASLTRRVAGCRSRCRTSQIPGRKPEIIESADQRVGEVERQYRRGLITDSERYREVISIWNEARDDLSDAVESELGSDNSLFMMSTSGAKGNINQISQMAGMRGLMLDPRGNDHRTADSLELP